MAYTRDTTPNAIEALHEVARRLEKIKFTHENDAIEAGMSAGRWQCIKVVDKLVSEISDGILDRMCDFLTDEEQDDQPTAQELKDSDEQDWRQFASQCGR